MVTGLLMQGYLIFYRDVRLMPGVGADGNRPVGYLISIERLFNGEEESA
jgi:hypothetical protein